MFVEYEDLESTARQGQCLPAQELTNFRDVVDDVGKNFKSIVPESVSPSDQDALKARHKGICEALNKLKMPSDPRLTAIDPLPYLWRQLAEGLIALKDYLPALVIQLNVVIHADPYHCPEPWNPHRAANLSDLANTLWIIVSRGGLPTPRFSDLFDLGPSMVAVLLLAEHYTSMSHGSLNKASLWLKKNIKVATDMMKEQFQLDERVWSKAGIQDARLMLQHGIMKHGLGQDAARKHLRRLAVLADIDLMYRILEG
jgi:hypothetical protein